MNKLRVARASAILVLALGGPAIAAEIELPPRKPGAWDIRVTTKVPSGVPQMAMRLCLDAETDKAIMERSLAISANCTMTQSTDADRIVISSSCARDGGKQRAETVITGDFQSHYTIAVTGDAEGGPPGRPSHTEITQEALWMGECPAELKPGEVQLPSGQTVNLLDALNQQAK